MFGPPGTAYLYRVYGMHDCLNVAVGPAGQPSAILIRAVAPLSGLAAMRSARVDRALTRSRVADAADRRQVAAERVAGIADARIASGPGLVTAALGISRRHDGIDLLAPDAVVQILEGGLDAGERVVATPRIGIGYAGEPWVSRAWRFVIAGHPSVSGPAAMRRGLEN